MKSLAEGIKMPYHMSPKKRLRRDSKQKLMNHARIHRIRTFVKKAETLILQSDAQARAALQQAQSELLRGVTKGVIHLNTASRKISRLTHRLTKQEGSLAK
jgi:small subunit ribosomal protein S20